MDELAIHEKYPNSWRADHLDFGDVHRTTYAKGIIKEFEKVSDDPLKVRSMVKVEIEGKGMSGFIPLFYHPKAQYWDDEEAGIEATDFNQEERYFEQAWMSFRAGDEVRVMLREDEPYAVVGFDDAMPRIGENIVKIEYQNRLYQSHFFHWRADKRYLYGEFDEEKKGPDNKDLRLTEACPKHLVWSKYEAASKPPLPYTYSSGGSDHYYHEWLVPIGPILWIFQVLSAYVHFRSGWSDEDGDHWTEVNALYTEAIVIQGGPFSKEFYERSGASCQVGNPWEAHGAGQRWFNEYPDFTIQKEFPGFALTLGYVASNRGQETDPRLVTDYYDIDSVGNTAPLYGYSGSSSHSDPWIYPDEIMSMYWRQFVPRWETVKFFVRPHNPAENRLGN